jgi:hypothetical protein
MDYNVAKYHNRDFKTHENELTRVGNVSLKRPGKGKVEVINNTIRVTQVRRDRQDINKWRRATVYAESATETRYHLYEIYKDCMIDTVLKSSINKRIGAITNTKVAYITKDGKHDEQLTLLARQKYFKTMLTEMINAKFWGFSLVQPFWPSPKENIKVGETELIDRRHVKPKLGIVSKTMSGTTGHKFYEKPISDYTIYAGDKDDLGLLLGAAFWVILKRGGVVDWAQFVSEYGFPAVIAKYNNEETRKAMNEIFETAGSALKLTVPMDADIDLKDFQAGSNSDLFDILRKACNEEITIGILGQTETTTSSASSGYAQSKTHEGVLKSIHEDDRDDIEAILNDQVISYLQWLGWNVPDGEFKFVTEDDMSLEKRIKIDDNLRNIIDVPEKYFYDKYGIPKPDKKESVVPKQSNNKDFF